MPPSEFGIELQLEYSECFLSPLLGKIGEIWADKESY